MADGANKSTQTQRGADGGELDEALERFAPLAERMRELQDSAAATLSPESRETLCRASETAERASEALAPGLRMAFESLGMSYELTPGAGETAQGDGDGAMAAYDGEARARLADELARRIPGRVREAREGCGISRKRMPRLCGMDSRQYRNIEDGRVAKPSICDLLCISAVTGKSLDWLIGRDA